MIMKRGKEIKNKLRDVQVSAHDVFYCLICTANSGKLVNTLNTDTGSSPPLFIFCQMSVNDKILNFSKS